MNGDMVQNKHLKSTEFRRHLYLSTYNLAYLSRSNEIKQKLRIFAFNHFHNLFSRHMNISFLAKRRVDLSVIH